MAILVFFLILMGLFSILLLGMMFMWTFVDSFCHIKEVSLSLLWLIFLDDRHEVYGRFFLHLLRCVLHGNCQSELPSGKGLCSRSGHASSRDLWLSGFLQPPGPSSHLSRAACLPPVTQKGPLPGRGITLMSPPVGWPRFCWVYIAVQLLSAQSCFSPLPFTGFDF